MAYRGPTQDEVDADMDSEAAIRLAEAGGDIMQVSMPIGANAAQWTWGCSGGVSLKVEILALN